MMKNQGDPLLFIMIKQIASGLNQFKRIVESFFYGDWRVGHFMLCTIVQKLRVTDRMIAGSFMIHRNLEAEFKKKLLSIADQENLVHAIHEVFHTPDPETEATIYDAAWICEELGVASTHIMPWIQQLVRCDAVRIHQGKGAIEVLDDKMIEQTRLCHDLTI